MPLIWVPKQVDLIKGNLTLPNLPFRRSPFIQTILAEAVPFEIDIPQFDGMGDPQYHIDIFYAKTDLYGLSDAAYCKLFRATLTKRALAWFSQLTDGTIKDLQQFTQKLLHQFSINSNDLLKPIPNLFKMVQKEGGTTSWLY